MTAAIDQIDRINEILEGLKAQTGAIAAITNPQHDPGNLCYISDFFWGMCKQLIDVMDLVNKLPLKD